MDGCDQKLIFSGHFWSISLVFFIFNVNSPKQWIKEQPQMTNDGETVFKNIVIKPGKPL